MSGIQDFAEFFKSRKIPIDYWYSDGVGKWAFRVEVDGQTFVCAVRKVGPKGGTTSVMKEVAGKAQIRDAYIALRLPGGIRVFDPVAALSESKTSDITEGNRERRGEDWIDVPMRLSCSFEAWYEGRDEPLQYHELNEF